MGKHTDFMKKLEIIQKADWTCNNAELGRQYGVAAYVISYLRKLHGKPPAKRGSPARLMKHWLYKRAKDGLVDWIYNDRDLSRFYNVSYSTIRRLRIHFGIPAHSTGCGARARPRPPSFDHSKIDWKLTDAENAKALGVSRQRIHQLRKKAGLPSSRELWLGKGSLYNKVVAR